MKLHLRKFCPIDRPYPIYEACRDGIAIFDISRSDDDLYDIAINPTAEGCIVPLDDFLEVVARAKAMLAAEDGTEP